MSTVAGLYRAKWGAKPLPEAVRKSQVNTSAMWSKAVLTYPGVDLAGDVLDPSGLLFDTHKLDPAIDLEHGRDSIGDYPVAWARESLSKPGGEYAVEYRSLNVAPDGAPPDFRDLPIGTSYFDPGCKVSAQVFALVEQDVLPAVSLEFRPVPGCYKSLGRSPLEPRDAYHFAKADVVKWTVCARGVNEGALSLTKSLRGQVPAELAKIVADNRVNVGGRWETLAPRLLKALRPLVAPPTRTTVRVERKAMDERDDMLDGAPVDDADMDTAAMTAVEDEVAEDTAPASNGVTALYAHVQAVADLCDKLEADLGSSDNPQLIADGRKAIEMMRAQLAKVSATADKHDAKLQAALGKGETEPDGDEMADATETDGDGDSPLDYEPDDEEVEKALRRDADGVLLHVARPVYRKALQVKRFKLADIEKAKPVEKPGDGRIDELEARLNRLLDKATKYL